MKPENNFIIAFRVLPLILVIGALSAVLHHWGILPAVVHALAFILKKTIGISGALGLGSASSVFLGTIESPLFIRPYLDKLTRSELFGLITCSMATIAGTVMVLYASVLKSVVQEPTTHLLTASLLSVPAALLLAHVMVPPLNPAINESVVSQSKSPYENTFDALMTGISESLTMVLNIVSVILVFFAFVYLTNRSLGLLAKDLTLQAVLGTLLKPFMTLIGIPAAETSAAADLMGTKIILNEFVAYLELAKAAELSQSTRIVMTYALCGFANFASAGIIIGGLTAIMPSRKSEISALTFKSLLSGNLACLMTAAIVSFVEF